MKLAWVLSDRSESELEPLLLGLRRAAYRVEVKPPRGAVLHGEDLRGLQLVVVPPVIEGQRSVSLLPTVIQGSGEGTQWAVLDAPKGVEQRGRFAAIGVQSFFDFPLEVQKVQQVLDSIAKRAQDPLREISDLVMAITGVQLDATKKVLVEKRLSKRLIELGLRRMEDYIQYFRRHREAEIPHLVSQLTTQTTQFFRDTTHFDYLVDSVLPDILRARRPIRIWSAACSTGEEVYSLAMAVEDTARRLNLGPPDYEILGTDIDPKAVQTAQQGIYPRDSIARLAQGLQEAFFDFGSGEIAHLAKIKSRIWSRCKFRIHNLLSDGTPGDRFDAVFARNVFIYFKADEVTRIACRMSEVLESHGRLFIGASETLDRKATGLKTVGGAIYALAAERSSVRPRAQAQPQGHAPASEPKALKRVSVVDDSKTVRTVLKSILSSEHGFSVVGEAENPVEARNFLQTHAVDLMTLDIHMPVMDGIQYLEQISGKTDHPPVVVLSSVNRDEAIGVFRCLELGAADYLEKPKAGNLALEADHIRQVLSSVIASGRKFGTRRNGKTGAKSSVSPVGEIRYRPRVLGQDLVLIGASTGGIEALRSVFVRFPETTPPIVVVQHIPPLFSRMFAKRLSEISKVPVVEAEDGMRLEGSRGYIAPGGKHLGIDLRNGKLYAMLSDAVPMHGCRPAVDYLFNSVVSLLPKAPIRVSAALLTGMGRDGADGLLSLRERGALTLAQDEETSIVFGMPKAAIDIGAAAQVLPLESIAHHLFEAFQESAGHGRKKAA